MNWSTTSGDELTRVSDAPAMAGGTLERHALIKQHLLRLLDGMAEHHSSIRNPALDLSSKLTHERFNLLTVGEFKRGKTCLVNALLGEALLPMGVKPLTSVASVLTYGESFQATVSFLDGSKRPIERPEIPDYVTEPNNPDNVKGVREVYIELPANFLRGGLRLIDTPGVGSIHQHNTDTAHSLLPGCDAALFVLSADQPVSKAELDFLAEVRVHAQKIFFLLNKIDYLGEAELADAMDYTQAALMQVMGRDVRLFPISAKTSLRSMGWMDAGLKEQSGMPHFVHALEDFLFKEKGHLVLRSAALSCKKLLTRIKLETEITLRAMVMSPAELERKILAFSHHNEQLREKRGRLLRDFEVWTAMPIESLLDPEIGRWKNHCLKRLQTDLLAYAGTLDNLPPEALDRALSQYLQDQIRTALTLFRETTTLKLTAEFEDARKILAAGMLTLIDQLQRFAAGMFQLTIAAPMMETGVISGGRDIFATHADPVGLEILSALLVRDPGSWLRKHFPRAEACWQSWARRRIIENRCQDLEDGLDMAAGRLRYSLLMQLQEACKRYSGQVLHWYEDVAMGITESLNRGLDASRKTAMTDRLTRYSLERQLSRVAEQAREVERLCAELDTLAPFAERVKTSESP